MKGKNQQKTSSTEKFNTLADMTEREGEIHHDDTAESGKSDFQDDMIWIWREIAIGVCGEVLKGT